MNVYKTRRAQLATWMARNSVMLVIFQDSEAARDKCVRYFTGHNGDAVLGIRIDGEAMLCPWDDILAKKLAKVDKIVPYTKFGRNPVQTVTGIIEQMNVPSGCRIEIPPVTSYPQFLRYVDALNPFDVICRPDGAHEFCASMRAVKDKYELDCYRKVSAITDGLIDSIETGLKNGSLRTESDVALFIEKECRAAGCEGTGFDTLAAGPERSFGIHCFPNYTAGDFASDGLSILDFGVKWEGYTSDITLTVARGELSEEQEKTVALVEKAYEAALELYKPGISCRDPAQKVDEIFAKAKRVMPHGLGHGVGFDAHEAPSVNPRPENSQVFEPGMVVTLEPGLYDAKLGGCRLENDILITAEGHEVLTHSRIIRL